MDSLSFLMYRFNIRAGFPSRLTGLPLHVTAICLRVSNSPEPGSLVGSQRQTDPWPGRINVGDQFAKLLSQLFEQFDKLSGWGAQGRDADFSSRRGALHH